MSRIIMRRIRLLVFILVLVLCVSLMAANRNQAYASVLAELFTEGLWEPSFPDEAILADDQETAQALAETYRSSLVRQGILSENQVISAAEYDENGGIWVFLIGDPNDNDIRSPGYLMGVSARTGECLGLSPQNVASILYWIVMKSANYLDKDQIFELVTEHRDELMDYIASGNYTEPPAFEGIQSVSTLENEYCVCFDCGGFGLVPDTHGFGFYYSPDSSAIAIEMCATEDLQPMGNGMGWKEDKGDNTYYTEEIIEHFFYYEAHY